MYMELISNNRKHAFLFVSTLSQIWGFVESSYLTDAATPILEHMLLS